MCKQCFHVSHSCSSWARSHFCQTGGGKLLVTDQLYKAFTKTGLVICCVFKEKSWKNAINKADYYKHDFTPEIPEDLAGGISCHGLMPLLSKKHRKKISCSLVLKVRKWDSLFFRVLTGTYCTTRCIAQLVLFFEKCTRYFCQHEASSESNCNRDCWGQPSWWIDWLLHLCTSTRVLNQFIKILCERPTPLYPLLYIEPLKTIGTI